jgi:hypothetical protein
MIVPTQREANLMLPTRNSFRIWLALSLFIVMLTVSGCLRSAASGSVVAAATSRPLPSATPSETFTAEPATEEPTEEIFVAEETATPTETEVPFEPLETATPDTLPLFEDTETPTLSAEEIALTQIAEALPTATFTPDLLNLFPTETETPLVVAQVSDDELTATALIQEVTQVFFDQTLTAQVIFATPEATATNFIFEPTEAPTAIFEPTQQPGVVGGECIHVVVAGDNLFRISLRYGTMIDNIVSRNTDKISNPQIIIVGDELVIPNCNLGGTSGGIDGGVSGGVGSCAGRFTHTVRQGETLFQISLQYDVPIQTIATCNNIPNINLIYYSQVLNIP